MKYFIIVLYLCLLPVAVMAQDKSLEQEITEMLDKEKPPSPASSQTGRYFQDFNPDMSLIIDGYYHGDSSREGIAHIFEEIEGFGHSCASEEHHHGPDEGINMQHSELYLSANVDPYFKAWGNIAVADESAEMEEAVIQTTSLPYGLQLKMGKFFSDIGRVNPQHAHSWDFSDQPLIYKLTLGDHGLNDKGLQLSWLMPTSFYLVASAETFQGNNEVMFQHFGGVELPDKSGPRIFTGWLKIAPNIKNIKHALQFGLFTGRGVHQEEHDGNADGAMDHWLNGYSKFSGIDLVYKYDDLHAYGVGDIIFQCEYLQREKDLTVENYDLNAALIGRHKQERQDGYYLQATYGFLERWRLGLRWEQIGMINEIDLPDGTSESPAGSNRLAAMVDWTLTEFSRIRLQLANGKYETPEGVENVSQIFLQLQISMGTHGAHKF